MCRIAGIFDNSLGNLEAAIITMRDCMKHGGPDAKGIYVDAGMPLALGHRRLSFLDLSPAGNQPMADPKAGLQIVFNGEIYNFSGLRKQLQSFGHSFVTTSDTEVILKAYRQWGEQCFARFNGMFALAIYDKPRSRLVLARDHAGIKPLYYAVTGNKLYFASEIRAFKAIKPDWPQNEEWKIYFLTFGHLPEPVTTLKDVVSLPKGHTLIIDLPGLQQTLAPFNTFSFSSKIVELEEAVGAVKEALTRAVERHLISDVPVGLFLSGGLDSSLLTLLAHKTLKENLHTLSINFEDEEFSEARYQRIIIDATGANHNSIVVKEEEFAESLPDILQAMDQPSIDGINSYFISKYAARNGLKAVLSGLGADELFGGYESFHNTNKINFALRLPSLVLGYSEKFRDYRKKRIAFLERKDLLGTYLLNRGLYTPAETAHILKCSPQEIKTALNKIVVPRKSDFSDGRQMVSWFEQNLYMQNQLLRDADYMSMWHSVEVRVPFLDKEVMEVAHSIAPEIKFDQFTKKHLLIKAFEDVLPAQISGRKKQGFIFPFSNWIKSVQVTDQRSHIFRRKHQLLLSGKIPWAQYWGYLLACHLLTIKYNNKPVPRVLFLNLKAFSKTGGIEKFNRALLKGLANLEQEGLAIADGWSCYDDAADEKYIDPKHYKGFKSHRSTFVFSSVLASRHFDVIMLGHINLATIGWVVKKLFPSKKVILIAHGIEVWHPLNGIRKAFIGKADQILAVSNFTRNTIQKVHHIAPELIRVFPNTIDPYFTFPHEFVKPAYLLNRYNLTPFQPVLFTLTRLAFSEKYKGYDKVMQIIPKLAARFPGIRYIIAGKPDLPEQQRLTELIESNNLHEHVLLTGFVPENEVADHFLLADTFVMPSSKEGFGIVFIEAMACGLQVIGGNKDGSVDALKNGEMGTLIDPESEAEIMDAIERALCRNTFDQADKRTLQRKVVEEFGFNAFTTNLSKVLAV